MTLDPVDEALARAVTSTPGSAPDTDDGLVSAQDLADASDLPVAVVEAVAREGLLLAVPGTDPPRYAPDDVDVLRAGATLLEAGLPLGELLDLARRTDEGLRVLADQAVGIFLEFIRDPVRGTTDDEGEATDRLVAAAHQMLPATGELVGAHFRRLLIDAAMARIQQRVDEPPEDTAS